MNSLGSIPEDFGFDDVWEVDLGTTLPGAVVGRRAQYDELIWDADGGFAGNWAGRSSLGGDGTAGYTMLLARRAYSAAGLALFGLAPASGGGGGSPTGAAGGDLAGTYPNPSVAKVAGVAVSGTPSAGQVIKATDGTHAAWAAEASGSGDVVGPASAVADRVAVFSGTTGKLLKDGGQTVASILAAAGAFAPAYYRGRGQHGKSFMAFATWTDVMADTDTWTDDLQVGITRSGSSITLTQSGVYVIMADVGIFGVNAFYGLRARINGTTFVTREASGTTTTFGPTSLNAVFTATAGDVLTVEYVTTGAAGAAFNGSSTLDSEPMSAGNISIFSVKTTS